MQHDEKLRPQMLAILESGPVGLVASSTGKAPQSSFQDLPPQHEKAARWIGNVGFADGRKLARDRRRDWWVGRQPCEDERRRRP